MSRFANKNKPTHLPTLAQRIEAFVSPEPNSGCYLWCGATTEKGYGRIQFRGQRRMVHQFAWEAAHGPMPKGHVIRHRCDVPACVNADHLLIGLQRDNVADMDARGRRGVKEERDGLGRFSRIAESRHSDQAATRDAARNLPQVLA